MEKYLKFCLSFCGLFLHSIVFSQVNCNAIEGADCKKACEIYNKVSDYQGWDVSQEGFNEAIKLCPNFDQAYREKSVPFLKRGDFITWRKLIDKAVEINPNGNLGYRAWCRFQFLRDYKGCLEDLIKFDSIRKGDVGYSQNGDYQLNIVKAMCYSGLNQKERAVKIIEKQLLEPDYHIGFYDYYQLGATYFQLKNYKKAEENFEKQSKLFDFAENIYFKAEILKIKKQNFSSLKNLALKTYDEGKVLNDPYTHHFNKIYREQIQNL